MSNKLEATFFPDPPPAPTFICPECKKPWYSQAVADDCCGDWLGYD